MPNNTFVWCPVLEWRAKHGSMRLKHKKRSAAGCTAIATHAEKGDTVGKKFP